MRLNSQVCIYVVFRVLKKKVLALSIMIVYLIVEMCYKAI